MSDQGENNFKRISPEEVTIENDGSCQMDLYVYLPLNDRYILFLKSGDQISDEHFERIREHVVPEFFVNNDSQGQRASEMDIPEEFKESVLSMEQEEKIDSIKAGILNIATEGDAQKTMELLSSTADDIIEAVAPETKSLREAMLENAKYVSIMNDSSAITTLSTLIAIANGFNSNTAFRELTYASIIMDVGMTELTEEELFLYYSDRDQLSDEAKKKVKMHPAKAHTIATEKLKSASETTLQLILAHHELFNGEGYPRGMRNEGLLPLAKVLSLAVDIFEHIKASELSNQKLELQDVLRKFQDENVEPHKRRHNKNLLDKTLNYFFPETEEVEEKVSAAY